MYPELGTFAGFTVTSFGVMMFLAFLVAAWVMSRQLGHRGLDRLAPWEMLGWVAFSGVIGAKLYYVALHPAALLADPLGELTSRGGLVWYGGLAGGAVAFLWQVRRRGFPLRRALDAAAPAVAIGYAVGRIGCFLVGDDYGRPTDGWMGVAFPDGYPPSTAGYFRSIGTAIPPGIADTAVLAVHPTQLYEALLAFMIFGVLLRLSMRLRPGRLFALYLALYGAARFLIEFVRAKTDVMVLGLTTSQLVSLILLAAGAIIWRRVKPAEPYHSLHPKPLAPLALLLALATLSPATPATAQENATAQDTLVAEPDPADQDSMVAPEPSPAAYAPPRFSGGLTLGRVTGSTLQTQPVLAERVAGDGTVLDQWTLRRSVDLDAVYQLGAWALVSLGPAWALRVGGGIGWGSLSSSFGGEPAEIGDEAEELAAHEPGIQLLSLVGALRFRIPATRRFRPYAELGLAAERWGVGVAQGSGAPGVRGLDGGQRLGAHLAVGGTLPIGDRLGLDLQLTSRLYRTPLDQTPTGTQLVSGDSLRLTFAAPVEAPFADAAAELLSTLQLGLGVSYRIPARPTSSEDPPEPPVSPPASGR